MKGNKPLDLTCLEGLNDIVSNSDYFLKATRKKRKDKKSGYFIYQYFNQFCTCVIRIRETSNYLMQFEFNKKNVCGEAFDFYEYINCISIIESCIESLFEIFNSKFEFLKTKKVFKISNTKKTGDLSFFKFVRSAASVHPTDTTMHNKQTGHKFEVYPYAVWTSDITDFLNEKPSGADIELLSWNCKTNGKYKRYYLSTKEFYLFTNELLISLKRLIPIVENLIDLYNEKVCCKRLKDRKQFESYSDYLQYLRKRLKNKSNDKEFADGGLLLANHIINNNLISAKFKNYIKNRVKAIRKKMIEDIKSIGYDDIFDNLYLGDVIGHLNNGYYTSQKFHDYLYDKAINEIEKNKYINFHDYIRYEENNINYTNSEWAVIKLLSFKDIIYINNGFEKAITYTDLYELTLEAIYFHKSKKI